MSDFIGPALPDHLLKKRRRKEEDVTEQIDSSYSPKRAHQGPVPPSKGVLEDDMASLHEPTVPDDMPDIKTSNVTIEPVSYGPALPPGFTESEGDEVSEHVPTEDQDEIIGPLPADPSSDNVHQIRDEINIRSQLTKEKLSAKDSVSKKPQREEWMMELPPEIQSIGLGPRKFKTKYNETGDRSVWTRMPGEESKEPEKKSVDKDEYIQGIRNQQLARDVEEYNRKNRSKSLVELHRKKKVSESKGQTEERQPFNRETDLALPKNLMTVGKQKKLIRDSEKSLDSKFTRGKSSFL